MKVKRPTTTGHTLHQRYPMEGENSFPSQVMLATIVLSVRPSPYDRSIVTVVESGLINGSPWSHVLNDSRDLDMLS